MPASKQFYPSLANLLPLEEIPPSLGAVEGALDDVFSKVFYKDLQIEKSAAGDAASYQLTLVKYGRLALEVPGTNGLALVLFPPFGNQPDDAVTDIPVSVSYRWDVLKYVREFDHAAVGDLPKLIYGVMLDIAGIDEQELLAEAITVLFGAGAADGILAFVDYYNATVHPANLLDPPTGADVAALLDDLFAKLINPPHDVEVFDFVFDAIVNADVSVDAVYDRMTQLFDKWLHGVSADDLKALCIPHFDAAITPIKVALEFPDSVLKPVYDDPNDPEKFDTLIPGSPKSSLSCTVGSLRYSTDSGMQFADGFTDIKFTRSQIANTGITLGFTNMKLDLSRTTNIPEATADGRPVDFVGVYVEKATIGLPKKWFKQSSNTAPGPQVIGTDIIIGTGGFTGKIGFDAAGVLHTKLGNFEASLTAFNVRFERNVLTESDIAGKLTIRGFKDAAGADAEVDIKAHIGQHGDFKVTATEPTGIVVSIPNILDFKIFTLEFGREDDRFFLDTSGTVTLTFKIPALTFDRPIAVDLKKLIIWEDGQFEIEGGTIILPQALTLKIGPVKLSVTAISMGSYARNGHKYKYFGFDGGVNVNPGGVDARANGVKVYWRTDASSVADLDIFVRVEGIAIDIVIPGSKSADEATVLISGFLQVKEPADPPIAGSTAGTEYAGGVSFKMPKAGIGGSAAMRLNPSIPNFIIDTELSISVPIPLGNTSLGIYGFRGLIGMRYVADRSYAPLALPADASWYEYYKKKVALSYKEGINIDKFAPRKGFAIGAGLTLGTVTDSGKAFSAKLFLLLSLPDALLLQGQAAVMSERVDLSPNDPPFSVLIAVTRQSVEAAFGVNYKLPEGGEILDLQALVEMGFYFNDSTAWYVNAGRDLPASKRITARLFTLFNAWSYLMLSSHGIKAGAGVSWDFSKGFGPIQVEAHAYLDAQGHISFKPKQIGGAILLGGSAAVRVFKFKLGLSVAAMLAAEAPHPFIVTGAVAVQVDLPRPFKKLGGTFTLDFTWTFDPFDRTRETHPVPIFNEIDVGEAAKLVNVATRERFSVNVPAGGASGTALPPPPGQGWRGNFDDFVSPLDSTLDVEFKKPIAPGPGVTNIGITGTAYANTELVPPQRGKSPQVQHQYVVEEVKIRSWNPQSTQWESYDVYGALTPLQHAAFVKPGDLVGLKQGWWQLDQPGRVNKLSLLSQTPLSYANDVAGPFVPENSGVTAQTIFCAGTPIKEQCLVVDEWRDLKGLTADRRYARDGVQFRVTGKDGQIIPFLNPFGLKNGLALKPESQLEIFLPEAAGYVSLRLSTLADNVTVLYQQRRQNGVDNNQQPVYGYVTVKREVLKADNLLRPVTYDAVGAPIGKVVVLATTSCSSLGTYLESVCGAAQQQLDGLQHQHDQLVTQAHEYQLLAQQFQNNNRCDPSLSIRYLELASALLAQAAAMDQAIKDLTALNACCRKLKQGGAGAPECNIDPTFDYSCLSFLFGLCWLPLRDQLFNNTIPSFSSLLGNNNAMVTAINKTIYPIWRPNTIYAVSIRTADNVSVPELGGPAVANAKYMHVGFCTKGPVGHSHTYRAEYKALVAQDRADQYRLQSLKPYIDFAKSYPDAGGNVLNAKPLFYVNPKLQLFYVHPYVYTMYGGNFDTYNGNAAARSTLEVSILDPVNPLPATPADPGHVGPVSLEFAANKLGRSELDVRLLNNMATQGDPCTGSGQSEGIAPMGIQSNVTVERLRPRKLYLAVFKAKYNNGAQAQDELVEVHRYNFQTSRYADFAEQVNSYRLEDDDGVFLKDAVYDDVAVALDATRAAQLAALFSQSSVGGDPLEREYADPFDRLMDGILRVGPLDPAVSTDFTVVRDGTSDKVIGILVRNPEPFNDPKVPDAETRTTIVLSQPGTPPAGFIAFHSKDRSKAFIGAASLDLALSDLEFTFTYLEYDGAAYVAASAVKVSLFPETSP
jgi:hypothetical protein